MKSPFFFITKPVDGKRYSNTKDIDGIELITSVSEEDHKFSNRNAEVIELPINYDGPIKKGDILLVHHNVFKFYNDMKGDRRSGKSFFKDDLFFVEPEQFYMYHDGEKWNAIDRYCFVKPIPVEESEFLKNTKEEPLKGEMMYSNDYLRSIGVVAGDLVYFAPDSEYEFQVDGEKMYRIYDHQITMKDGRN
jgi:hypothetical protein